MKIAVIINQTPMFVLKQKRFSGNDSFKIQKVNSCKKKGA